VSEVSSKKRKRFKSLKIDANVQVQAKDETYLLPSLEIIDENCNSNDQIYRQLPVKSHNMAESPIQAVKMLKGKRTQTFHFREKNSPLKPRSPESPTSSFDNRGLNSEISLPI